MDVIDIYSDILDGKLNMIVVYEMVDDVIIWEEINYEKNIYEDVFVYVFVDGNNIIVILNIDYEVWGVGYLVNGWVV